MATSKHTVDDLNEVGSTVANETHEESAVECAVCLQSCQHAVELPCSHIFCFLCIKGASYQSRRCPICRQGIPQDFLTKPKLVHDLSESVTDQTTSMTWFYEGRNGWWRYDQRTASEIERYFNDITPKVDDNELKENGNDEHDDVIDDDSDDDYLDADDAVDDTQNVVRKFDLLIAGLRYTIDLGSMLQYRRGEPQRCRRIKRDRVDAACKGVAGIRNLQERESDHQIQGLLDRFTSNLRFEDDDEDDGNNDFNRYQAVD